MSVFVSASYLKLAWCATALRLCSDQQYFKKVKMSVLHSGGPNDKASANKTCRVIPQNLSDKPPLPQHNATSTSTLCTFMVDDFVHEWHESTVNLPNIKICICGERERVYGKVHIIDDEQKH